MDWLKRKMKKHLCLLLLLAVLLGTVVPLSATEDGSFPATETQEQISLPSEDARSDLSEDSVEDPQRTVGPVTDGVYRIRNYVNGHYMTFLEDSPGDWRVSLYESSTSGSGGDQLWIITSVGNGYYEIRSLYMDGYTQIRYCISTWYGDLQEHAVAGYASGDDTAYGYLGAEDWIWKFSENEINGVTCYAIFSPLVSSNLIWSGTTNDTRVLASTDAYGDDSDYWTLEPYLPEGDYFLRNMGRKSVAGINGQPGTNTTISGQTFTGSSLQKWRIAYDAEGFYTISPSSNPAYYLGAEDVAGNDALVLSTTVTDYSRWMIYAVSNNSYWLAPKANSYYDYGLNANSTSSITCDYISTGSNNSKWAVEYINRFSATPLEGQQKSKWCWAASARMLAKHYYPSVTYTQTQAVTQVKESDNNVGGSVLDAYSAVQYYLSNVYSGTFYMACLGYQISMEQLRSSLRSGNVVYVARAKYNEQNERIGHAILVAGYVTTNKEIRFIIRDPYPVNQGKTFITSYEALVDESDVRLWETPREGYVWEDTLKKQ